MTNITNITNVINMTDEELLSWGRAKEQVTILENELLMRLEQKLEEEDDDDARGQSKEESQRIS